MLPAALLDRRFERHEGITLKTKSSFVLAEGPLIVNRYSLIGSRRVWGAGVIAGLLSISPC
jgi:hypothetical protein